MFTKKVWVNGKSQVLNVPVLDNTETFVLYQYQPLLGYQYGVEQDSIVQCDPVLPDTHVPVSGT